MLHLIENSKGGRNLSGLANDGVNWKEIFKKTEDSLTSSIFGPLFYLPVELLCDILFRSTYESSAFPLTGRLLNYQFWPRWQNDSGSYKEPDLLIEFENFNIIIEAKRFDYSMQNSNQWEEEIKAYFSEFGFKKDVYMIAVGGIFKNDESTTLFQYLNITVKIVKCRWGRILKQLISIQKHLDKYRGFVNANDAILNIINDLILTFRMHGFQTGSLFETMTNNLSLKKSIAEYKVSLEANFKRK
ncbi:MAG: hypothetical protein V4687_00990 [Bacteroidota bacterium]